jgi:regulator of protease activity HflC (stomatin/prohibitin superfamily)
MTEPFQCTASTKLLAAAASVLALLIFIIALVASSAHTIDEGNVGIYFVQGALSDEVTPPGKHYAVPFITEIREITTRPVTSHLQDIRTITRDGIVNTFRDIQVISKVNQKTLIDLVKQYGPDFRQALIFDRVAEELRIFCANHTIDEVYNQMFLSIVGRVKTQVEKNVIKLIGNDSISLLNLVIPKPDIPNDILKNYRQVKVQWTEQLVAKQKQKTEKIKEETETIKELLDAERDKSVLEIKIRKDLLQKEGERNLSALNNAIIRDREENQANVDNYKKTKDAEANKRLYTKEFIRLQMAQSLSKNTKFFFSGESSPLGAVLAKIMGENK